MLNSRLLGLALLVSGCIGIQKPCWGLEGSVDQRFALPPFISSISNEEVCDQFSWAQTFPIGQDGILAGIGVQIWRKPNTAKDLIVQIKQDSPNNPTVLASAHIQPVDVPLGVQQYDSIPFTFVDISSLKIHASVGDIFAIVLSTDDPLGPTTSGYAWQSSSQALDLYPIGSGWVKGPTDGSWVLATGPYYGMDQGFESFVIPAPEPASLCTFSVAVAALALCRRVRPKVKVL